MGTNRRGKDFVPLYRRYNVVGRFHATWKVGGEFAGRDKMRLKPGDH